MTHLLLVGGPTWKEAPTGSHLARCTKVDPDWKFMGNRKVAIYFTVTEGEHEGTRARLFFAKRSTQIAEETGVDFGPGSKFFDVLQKLFPEVIGDGSKTVPIDPVELFLNRIFKITVECRLKKSGGDNAIVTEIDHPDVEF